MSVTRSRQSLRGTDGLGEDGIAKLGAKTPGGHEVDLAAEQLLQPLLDVEEVEEADRAVELDQGIDVATRLGLIPGHGAKQREAPDAEVAKFALVQGDDLECSVPAHLRHHRRLGRQGEDGPALSPRTEVPFRMVSRMPVTVSAKPYAGAVAKPVSREKLYEELWAEPATTVAARYGITSTYLARVCQRLNVPRPPRGYWAKKEFGKAPEPNPLPAPLPGDELEWSQDGWQRARRAPPVRRQLHLPAGDNCTSPSLRPAGPQFRCHSATLEDGGVKATDGQVRKLMEEMVKHGRVGPYALVSCHGLQA